MYNFAIDKILGHHTDYTATVSQTGFRHSTHKADSTWVKSGVVV